MSRIVGFQFIKPRSVNIKYAIKCINEAGEFISDDIQFSSLSGATANRINNIFSDNKDTEMLKQICKLVLDNPSFFTLEKIYATKTIFNEVSLLKLTNEGLTNIGSTKEFKDIIIKVKCFDHKNIDITFKGKTVNIDLLIPNAISTLLNIDIIFQGPIAQAFWEYLMIKCVNSSDFRISLKTIIDLTRNPFTCYLHSQSRQDQQEITGFYLPWILKYVHEITDQNPNLSYLKWSSRLYCLDIDVQEDKQLDILLIKNILERINFTPLLITMTHGGGIHIFVEFKENALLLKAFIDNHSNLEYEKLEILENTRMCNIEDDKGRIPKMSLKEMEFNDQEWDIIWLKYPVSIAMLSDGEIEEILEQNNLKIGQRLPHTDCPIKLMESNSKDAVVILNRFIYCHVCHDGIPIAYLGTSRKQKFTELFRNAKNFVAFNEARKFIHKVFSTTINWPEFDLRLVYQCILRLIHGSDQYPKIKYTAIEKLPIVLTEGYRYIDIENGCFQNKQDIKFYIKRLPHIKFANGLNKVELLRTAYQAQIVPEIGLFANKVTSGYTLDLAKIRGIVTTKTFEEHTPIYIEESKRNINYLNLLFLDDLPRSKQLIEFLIVLKLYADLIQETVPFVFAYGITESYKTFSGEMAAAILNSDFDKADLRANTIGSDPLGIIAGTPPGQIIIFDECSKMSKRAYNDVASIHMELLRYRIGISVRHLYMVTKILGPHPILMTDIHLPFVLQADAQLARRYYVCNMEMGQNNLETNNRELPYLFTNTIRPKFNKYDDTDDLAFSANCLLSEIIDKYFNDINNILRSKNWLDQIATDLNIKRAGPLKETIKVITDLINYIMSTEDKSLTISEDGRVLLPTNKRMQHVLSRMWDEINCLQGRTLPTPQCIEKGTLAQRSEYFNSKVLKSITGKYLKIYSELIPDGRLTNLKYVFRDGNIKIKNDELNLSDKELDSLTKISGIKFKDQK